MPKGSVRFLPNLLSSRSGKQNDHHGSKDATKEANTHGKDAVLRLPYSSQAPQRNHSTSQPKQKLSATLAQLHRQQLRHEAPPHLSQNAAHALYTGRRQDRVNRDVKYNDDVNDDEESTCSSNAPGGYALEFDCGESVSSLNDSCFGGASVTGGYNIYPASTTTMRKVTEPQVQYESPMKQATSLVVGKVPSICGLSVSDHPSFDTEDISYYVHDVEQPPMLSPLPLTQSDNSNEVEENSLINAKDGRLRTMMPILTGTLSPKQKRGRSFQRGNSSAKCRDSATVENGKDHTHTTNTTSAAVQAASILPRKVDTTSSLMISTTSSETHHESQIVEMIAPQTTSNTTTTSTSSTSRNNKRRFTCYPLWLQRVPFWMKVSLYVGWVLLLLAIIVAIVGGIVSSIHQKNINDSSAASLYDDHVKPNIYNDTITADPTWNNDNNIFREPNTTDDTIVAAHPTVAPSISPSSIRRPKPNKNNNH
jgi:hypothetical protein